MNEIHKQYTRLLKHLRVHSEILSKHENLKPLSINLQNYLKDWQKNIIKYNKLINSSEIKQVIILKASRQDISTQIKDATIRQDQMAVELPEYQELQEFILKSDERYFEIRERELNFLAKELMEK